ncbi:MAG: hypothetical protein IJS94_03945, partial [Clostridia bacterium]|nr:hypothetical protein [Clostridia bacterium]
MLTVVISEKKHINSIKEYEAFLRRFTDSKSVAFCEWHPDGKTMIEKLPSLYDVVSSNEEWRAVIVNTEDGIEKKNPFDLAECTYPEETKKYSGKDAASAEHEDDGEGEENDEKDDFDEFLVEYHRARTAAKEDAYNKAKDNPLTCLLAFLCEDPITSQDENDKDLDVFHRLYLEEAAEKRRLLEEIRGGEKLNVTYPVQTVCISLRSCTDRTYDIDRLWQENDNIYYSDFVDRNMYYERNRFFVFDILPEKHRRHASDYLRFLCVLLIIAKNPFPEYSLASGVLYRLQCNENSEELYEIIR